MAPYYLFFATPLLCGAHKLCKAFRVRHIGQFTHGVTARRRRKRGGWDGVAGKGGVKGRKAPVVAARWQRWIALIVLTGVLRPLLSIPVVVLAAL